jgi:hypothetical protein
MLNTAAAAANKSETIENIMTTKKFYDYTLKYIMIGDSDIGKEEIFEFLDRSNTSNQANSTNNSTDSPQITSPQTKSGLFNQTIRVYY